MNPLRAWRQAALLLLAVGLAGCASLPGGLLGPVSTRAGEPFVIARSVSNQWGRVTHPRLYQLAGGRLVCTYGVVGDVHSGVRGIAGASAPSYSDDGGRTWTAGDPMEWVDGQPPVPTFFEAGRSYTNHFGFFWGFSTLPGGRQVAWHRDFRRMWAQPVGMGTLTNQLVWSDDGVRWHGPTNMFAVGFPTNNFPGCEINHLLIMPPRGVVLPDGRLLAAAYNMPFHTFYKLSAVLLESTNGGQSLHYVTTIANTSHVPRVTQWGFEGPSEPALARLPDGELLCVMRTGTAMINQFVGAGYQLELLEARSRDEGRTWTTRQYEDIRGVAPCLLQMSNGVLALSYGRPGARIVFSTDGGHTWSQEIELVPYAHRTSGYVDLLEVAPGRILAVYDTHNMPPAKFWLWEPPTPVNTVYGMFIDVAPR